MHERRNRIDSLENLVMASCVDHKEMSQTENYFEKNVELVIDILNVLDGIKERVQKETLLNLHRYRQCLTPPVEGEDNESEFLPKKNLDGDGTTLLFGSSSRNQYEKIHENLLTDFCLNKDTIPSYHTLTKIRPQIEEIHSHKSPSDHYLDETNFSIPTEVDDVMSSNPNQIQVRTRVNTDNDGDLLHQFANAVITKTIVGSKVCGTYQSYIKMLTEKHMKKMRPLHGEVIMLDSFDGEEHSVSHKDRISLVSYNSQLISKSTVYAGASPSGSFNILT